MRQHEAMTPDDRRDFETSLTESAWEVLTESNSSDSARYCALAIIHLAGKLSDDLLADTVAHMANPRNRRRAS